MVLGSRLRCELKEGTKSQGRISKRTTATRHRARRADSFVLLLSETKVSWPLSKIFQGPSTERAPRLIPLCVRQTMPNKPGLHCVCQPCYVQERAACAGRLLDQPPGLHPSVRSSSSSIIDRLCSGGASTIEPNPGRTYSEVCSILVVL